MNKEAITAAMADYESNHPVDNYIIDSVHVWPIIRNWLSYRLMALSEQPDHPHSETPPPSKLSKIKTIQQTLWANLPNSTIKNATKPSDALFITCPTRVFQRNGQYYHYQTAPVIEQLTQRNLTSTTWYYGQRIAMANQDGTFKLNKPLEHAIRLLSLRNRVTGKSRTFKAPPDWFADFAPWASDLLGRQVTWHEYASIIQYLLTASKVLEKWLARIAPRFLFLDCWYNLTTMAASLAASRLGITTIDLEHGLQGAAHFGYSGWTKAPQQGYSVIPDKFWVWGQEDAASLLNHNCPQLVKDNVIIGSNLWMNQWRQHAKIEFKEELDNLSHVTSGYSKVILVTLLGIPKEETNIIPAIAQSPKDWLWLIRPHRDFIDQQDQLKALYQQQTRHPNINVHDATTYALYALFQKCDLHLTWYSTCALEAVAFHKPTVILHATGAHAFKKQIDDGLMIYAQNNKNILSSINACENISPDTFHKHAYSTFAGIDQANDEIDRLIN